MASGFLQPCCFPGLCPSRVFWDCSDGHSPPRAGHCPHLSPWGLQAAPHVLPQVCGAAQKLLWCLQSQVLVSRRGTKSAQLWVNLMWIKPWLPWVLRQGRFVCPCGRSWMLHGTGAVPEGWAGAGKWDTSGTLGSMNGGGDGAAFSSSQGARAHHGAVPGQNPGGQ